MEPDRQRSVVGEPGGARGLPLSVVRLLGGMMMVAGGGVWFSWKFMVGPFADADQGVTFLLLVALCWGGLVVAGKGKGGADMEDKPAATDEEGDGEEPSESDHLQT